MFSLDVDVNKQLGKLTNASALINGLLRHHFGDKVKQDCPHSWGQAFGTAEGLVKECTICHIFKDVKYK